MKIVIGLLLAVNLLLFYWLTQESSQSDALLSEVATNMPPLQLLSETIPQKVPKPFVTAEQAESDGQSQQQPEQVSVQTAEMVEKPPIRAVFLELSCYSLGPFDEENSVKSASSTLSELGLVTSYKSETRQEVSGYWVYLPPFPTRDDARKVISMLKERGIKDFLIVSNGVKRNAISLGFFGTRDGAQQHQTRMKAIGLNPILEEAHRETNGFWLDFSSPNTPPLPATVIEALQSQYDEISMKKRPCLK